MSALYDHNMTIYAVYGQRKGTANQGALLVTLMAQALCPVTLQQHITDDSKAAFVGKPRDVAISLCSF